MVTKNITLKHTHSGTDSSIRTLVEQKLAALEKYVGTETDVRTEVEFEKVVAHKSGPVCRVEVNVFVAGKVFRSESTQETFEAALDIVKDDLATEMQRSNDRHLSLVRRGARKFKEMLRFS